MDLLIRMKIIESAFSAHNFLRQGHLIFGNRQPILSSLGSEVGTLEYWLPKANHFFLPLWIRGWKPSKFSSSTTDGLELSSDILETNSLAISSNAREIQLEARRSASSKNIASRNKFCFTMMVFIMEQPLRKHPNNVAWKTIPKELTSIWLFWRDTLEMD